MPTVPLNPESSNPSDTQFPHILLVDNDESLIAAMTARLSSQGYHCMSAGNGEEGLALFNSQSIDLIITDLNMPNGDGIDFITNIRDVDDEVPIVVATGFSIEYAMELCAFADVQVVGKPFKSQVLIDTVDQLLFLYQQQRMAG